MSGRQFVRMQAVLPVEAVTGGAATEAELAELAARFQASPEGQLIAHAFASAFATYCERARERFT